MTENEKVGFDLPKPDMGMGKVTIGGDAVAIEDITIELKESNEKSREK